MGGGGGGGGEGGRPPSKESALMSLDFFRFVAKQTSMITALSLYTGSGYSRATDLQDNGKIEQTIDSPSPRPPRGCGQSLCYVVMLASKGEF